jgi:phosphosulfolactate synthase
MVLDKCQGPQATEDLLTLASDYIDQWKFSYGTSALIDEVVLRGKTQRIKSEDVLVFPGGTLGEYAVVQGRWRDYLHHARELGFNAVEISDGTIDLSPTFRRDAIRSTLDLGLVAIAEVGKKDPEKQAPPEQLAEQALADFDSGASWVTVEARESGRGVGVFGEDGSVLEGAVETMAGILKDRLGQVVWEAPLKRQQEYFILRFGADVCLGNIQPRDVLSLEAMRECLRFETFRTLAEKAALEEPQTQTADEDD